MLSLVGMEAFLAKIVVVTFWLAEVARTIGRPEPEFQALVYDILPPTTAIIDYSIGLGKLSANEQFFIGTQMAVRL